MILLASILNLIFLQSAGKARMTNDAALGFGNWNSPTAMGSGFSYLG
jgi:hypothetical protein